MPVATREVDVQPKFLRTNCFHREAGIHDDADSDRRLIPNWSRLALQRPESRTPLRWGSTFSIAQYGSKPLYQGPKSWAAEAKIAGKIGFKLGVVGLAFTGYNIVDKGFTTSNTLDAAFGLVSFAGPVGAGIGGTYFVANMITLGATGQTIGEHVDNNFIIMPGPVLGVPIFIKR